MNKCTGAHSRPVVVRGPLSGCRVVVLVFTWLLALPFLLSACLVEPIRPDSSTHSSAVCSHLRCPIQVQVQAGAISPLDGHLHCCPPTASTRP